MDDLLTCIGLTPREVLAELQHYWPDDWTDDDHCVWMESRSLFVRDGDWLEECEYGAQEVKGHIIRYDMECGGETVTTIFVDGVDVWDDS